jgi:dehydrogenase/reductase SDR family member 1
MMVRRRGRSGARIPAYVAAVVVVVVVALRNPLFGGSLTFGNPSCHSKIRRSTSVTTTTTTHFKIPSVDPLRPSRLSASTGDVSGPIGLRSSNDDDIRIDSQHVGLKGRSLEGCVCLVTGASRGIGKGVAVELGRAGAVVYVTGTSSTSKKPSSSSSPYATSDLVGGPGTIEETAQQVTEAGGMGIPVYCNHANDGDVKSLFRTIQQQHGRLDILVNNAFRVPGGPDALYGKFWEQGPDVWDCLHTVGLRSHYVASCYAAPLLLQSKSYWTSLRQQTSSSSNNKNNSAPGVPRPLIVMVSSFGGLAYAFNVAYGVAKAGVDRLAKDMAVELASEDVCVVSLWPGVVATERTERAVRSGDWDRHVGLPLDHCESPRFTGRAVRAIALDRNNMKKSGSYQVVAELAEEYGFVDVNGQRPPSIRSLRFLLPTYGMTAELRSKVPARLIPDWKLPFWVMAGGAPPPPPRKAE